MDVYGLVAHVFVATLAFGFAVSLDFVLVAVARTRRIDAIQTVYEAAAAYGRWIGPLFGLAVVLGFALALTRHESLTQPWLIVTYVLTVVGAGVGIGLGRQRTLAVLTAARDAREGMTPELERAIVRSTPIGGWLMLLLMALILTIMFVKPFSA